MIKKKISDTTNVTRALREAGRGVYGHIAQEIKVRSRDFQLLEFDRESALSRCS